MGSKGYHIYHQQNPAETLGTRAFTALCTSPKLLFPVEFWWLIFPYWGWRRCGLKGFSHTLKKLMHPACPSFTFPYPATGGAKREQESHNSSRSLNTNLPCMKTYLAWRTIQRRLEAVFTGQPWASEEDWLWGPLLMRQEAILSLRDKLIHT